MLLARKPSLLLAVAALALGGLGQAMPQSAQENFKRASAAMARGDGIAAEAELQRAAAAGAKRPDIAAAMGEALIAQGELDEAREWLEPGQFARDQAAHGWRMLALLERMQGNLAAAGKALDQGLSVAPKDPLLWIEIGRLRYVGGEQLQAVDAAERALVVGPENVRALEFRAQLLSDAMGPIAAIPLYEKALEIAPGDLDLLGGYAAVLGEAGRAKDMLRITRRILAKDARNPQALYLQAILAARAGNVALGRAMLNRAAESLGTMPAALLLSGALELEAGNANAAVLRLASLVAQQPANRTGQLLLARALYEAGDHNQLFVRFGGEAQRGDASPYLLTLLARALEDRGDRIGAAALLDRAAQASNPGLMSIGAGGQAAEIAARWSANTAAQGTVVPYVRSQMVAGNLAAASSAAQRYLDQRPGSADALSLIGDVELSRGAPQLALQHYMLASRVRFPAQMLPRIALAYNRAGQGGAVQPLLAQYLAMFPRSRTALRMAASEAATAGAWSDAQELLRNLAARGGARDWRLLSDLSFAQLRGGDAKAATETARRAWRLQPAAALTNQVYGMALAEAGKDPAMARQLLDTARRLGGDNPLLDEARKKLK